MSQKGRPKRGRPQTPAEFKKKRGTLRRDGPSDAKPETSLPKPPSHLDRYAKAEWRRAGAILESHGIISDMDLAAFACYCTAYSQLLQCNRDLKKAGSLTMEKIATNGQTVIVKRPEVPLRNEAMSQILRFLTEFGLSPGSRGRVDLKPSGDADDDLASKYMN